MRKHDKSFISYFQKSTLFSDFLIQLTLCEMPDDVWSKINITLNLWFSNSSEMVEYLTNKERYQG